MHEAEIVEWLVKPGDILKLDQTMVKVETDKAVVEIPSPVSGRVSEIRVQDGQVAKVGDVLVVFETREEGKAATVSKSAGTSPAGQLPEAGEDKGPTTGHTVPQTASNKGPPYRSPPPSPLRTLMGFFFG
jgi:pyruvate dehydrogenase E2 component (dihydrolipoamide acetyltransferase)